jgi:hypothetical protein
VPDGVTDWTVEGASRPVIHKMVDRKMPGAGLAFLKANPEWFQKVPGSKDVFLKAFLARPTATNVSRLKKLVKSGQLVPEDVAPIAMACNDPMALVDFHIKWCRAVPREDVLRYLSNSKKFAKMVVDDANGVGDGPRSSIEFLRRSNKLSRARIIPGVSDLIDVITVMSR